MTDSIDFYIAGPMTGLPLYNFPAFDECAHWIRANGKTCISPAELDRDAGFDEHTTGPLPFGFMEQACRRDLATLLQVKNILLLDGWQQSVGTRFELQVAYRLGLGVRYYCLDGPPRIRNTP